MKRTCCLIIFTLLVIFISGCNKEERVPRIVIGTGEVVSETVQVSSFHTLRLVGIEYLTVNQGESQELILKAQQNVIDVLSHEVSNGVLTIDFPPKVTVSATKPVTVEVTHPELTRISLEGQGNFELDGEYTTQIELEFAGIGNMDGYNLYLSICNFILSGTGNCKVRVDSILNVTLSGYGNVLYKGDPELTTTITGVGQVIDDG